MVGSQTLARLDVEDALRADLYGLLGRLLALPPDSEQLVRLGSLRGDDTSLGQAFSALALAAQTTSPIQAEDEFNALFIGVSRGELVPFGSFYLTGFLHELPLAALRQDMRRLGIARAEGISESEDHVASLCEMMRGLIEGTFGAPADLELQRRFFTTHLASWGETFFDDLATAPSARLYRPVGQIGRLFLAIESEAFAMLD